MTIDPIDEIREIKRKLSEEFEFDIRRIAEETRRRQRKSDREFIKLSPRRPESQKAG